jgi:hypothetical protein
MNVLYKGLTMLFKSMSMFFKSMSMFCKGMAMLSTSMTVLVDPRLGASLFRGLLFLPPTPSHPRALLLDPSFPNLQRRFAEVLLRFPAIVLRGISFPVNIIIFFSFLFSISHYPVNLVLVSGIVVRRCCRKPRPELEIGRTVPDFPINPIRKHRIPDSISRRRISYRFEL